MFVYVGAYDGQEPALADLAAVKDAGTAGRIGMYQSAVFSKQPDGKAKVLSADSTTRALGARWGEAVGAVASILLPASLVSDIAAGTASGVVAGRIGKTWFASDVKDLADALLAGQLGLILVAQAAPDVRAEQLLENALRVERKPIDGMDRRLTEALEADA